MTKTLKVLQKLWLEQSSTISKILSREIPCKRISLEKVLQKKSLKVFKLSLKNM
jgi:hypothetical protein